MGDVRGPVLGSPAQLLCPQPTAPRMGSLHLVPGLLPLLLPSIFPSVTVLSKGPRLPMMHSKQDNFCFVLLAYHGASGSIRSRTPWPVFLAVQGPRSALAQTTFQKNRLPPAGPLRCPASASVGVTGKTRLWLVWASVPEDASGLGETFPKPPAAALPSLSLLLVSWLQSP